MSTASSEKANRGLALLDGLLLIALIGIVGLTGVSTVEWVRTKANRRIVEREARRLYAAFGEFHDRHGRYPNTHAEPRLELETLVPLVGADDDFKALTRRLLHDRVDAYNSPDDDGLNQEFWVEMTLAGDPSVRYLVARSDDAPLGGGKWLDGVYVLRNGNCEPL